MAVFHAYETFVSIAFNPFVASLDDIDPFAEFRDDEDILDVDLITDRLAENYQEACDEVS